MCGEMAPARGPPSVSRKGTRSDPSLQRKATYAKFFVNPFTLGRLIRPYSVSHSPLDGGDLIMLIIGAVIVLVLAVVGLNLSRGSAAGDRAPAPPTQLVIHRPQALPSEADTWIVEREQLRRHFLKGPGLAR
jgi:hypothetical protein